MSRIVFFWLVISTLTACGSSTIRPNAPVVAATPERMVVLSVRKTSGSAKITALADRNRLIHAFIEQLEKSSQLKIELRVIQSMTICGRHLSLAELQLNGDTSLLQEMKTSSEILLQFLGADVQDTQCLSEINGNQLINNR